MQKNEISSLLRQVRHSSVNHPQMGLSFLFGKEISDINIRQRPTINSQNKYSTFTGYSGIASSSLCCLQSPWKRTCLHLDRIFITAQTPCRCWGPRSGASLCNVALQHHFSVFCLVLLHVAFSEHSSFAFFHIG